MTALLFTLPFLIAQPGDDTALRHHFRDELRQTLPHSAAWETWLDESGELPPNFDAMPSIQGLPDPLRDGPGGTVTTAAEWTAQRDALLELFHRWIIGSVPPAPGNLRVEVLSETMADGATVREVELRFGPDHQAKMWAEIMIPDGPGPFPLFMTQHNHRGWGLIALRRGYAVCVYAGSDSRDDTATFMEAYPEHDWSKLTRRGWAASRCIDYLETLPQIDGSRIALTGHSRNGKLSLIGAAIDPRITAVISSSSGAGGILPTRHFGEHHFGEGIENITRQFPDWFHPRFRFFAGREDRLPVDFHQLAALAAPRACLLSIALNDPVESTWAMETTYRAVRPVYELFGADDKLRILYRSGAHETSPAVIERYLDWCDQQFGRGEHDFPEPFFHDHDWAGWTERHAALDPGDFPARNVDLSAMTAEQWHNHRPNLRRAVETMLGEAPPAADPGRQTYGVEPAHVKQLLRRSDAGSALEKEGIVFGEYINADVFMPDGFKDDGEKHPAVLWLPAACPSTGYIPAYRRGEYPHRVMARAGYVTFCFDPIGYGRRIEEVQGFYTRYPTWSLLGKMVRDAQAALGALEDLPYVDPDRIFVVGYHLGALVALHLAALDDRPAGYALVAPPAPFNPAALGVDGGPVPLADAFEPMLLPNAGLFADAPGRMPYDVPELLAAMAPKPAIVVTPRLDRLSPLPHATAAIEAARSIFAQYGGGELLQRDPHTYNHFDANMQRFVVQWLTTHP